jgi:phage terminase Nu1 subunit (DNA packaging protein)
MFDKKDPLTKKARNYKHMTRKEWQEHIQPYITNLSGCVTYKGRELQDFDGWDTKDIEKWIKDKEQVYTNAKVNNLDTEFLKIELLYGRKELAARKAKYIF